jgi:hypothetical protein
MLIKNTVRVVIQLVEMAYHYENNELTDICAMLSEYSRGIHQTVRKAISGKTPSWATSVIKSSTAGNRQDRTQNFRKQ